MIKERARIKQGIYAIVVGCSALACTGQSRAASSHSEHAAYFSVLETALFDDRAYGMRFFDEKVQEAIAMVERTENAAAMKLLEEELAKKGLGKERQAELALGLAMIQIRSAEWSKSSTRLNALEKSTVDATIPHRARALEAIRRHAMSDKEGAKERLSTRAGWQTAVLGGKTQLWKDLEKNAKQLDKCIEKRAWDHAVKHLDTTSESLRALATIDLTVKDLTDIDDRERFADDMKLDEMAKEYFGVLRGAIEHCRQHIEDCEREIRRQEDIKRKLQQEEHRCPTEQCRASKQASMRTCDRQIEIERDNVKEIDRWQDRLSKAEGRAQTDIDRVRERRELR